MKRVYYTKRAGGYLAAYGRMTLKYVDGKLVSTPRGWGSRKDLALRSLKQQIRLAGK